MERQGRQELQMQQRNAAAEKKKLEATVQHLESRITMLEEVINSADDQAADADADNDAVAVAVADADADAHADVDAEHASSRQRTNFNLMAAIDNDSASPHHAPLSGDSSPPLSPSEPNNARLILQLQEENQKLADAKLKAQLRYAPLAPAAKCTFYTILRSNHVQSRCLCKSPYPPSHPCKTVCLCPRASVLRMRADRKPAVAQRRDVECQTQGGSCDAGAQTAACSVYAWQSDCRVPVLPACNKVCSLACVLFNMMCNAVTAATCVTAAACVTSVKL